jgi:hypothetical protein
MQDLESGLSLMLRSDIATQKFISGEKMEALKEILRVLVEVYEKLKEVSDLTQFLKFYFILKVFSGQRTR